MIKNKKLNFYLSIASFMMALCILLGAFAAHGLKSIIEPSMLQIFHTGVEYQFYNTLGLFAVCFIIYLNPSIKIVTLIFWLILFGTIIFSFSLYLLAILKIPIIGIITPIGGTLQVIAWLLLSINIYKISNK